MELPIELFIQLLGYAALGIVVWWRLGKIEGLLKEQNGRIDTLEEWKANRQGYIQGLEDGAGTEAKA